MHTTYHKSDSRTALAGTVIVHTLLLLLLISFSIEQPRYVEPAVEEFDVMLGEDDMGDGQGENVEVMRAAPSATRPAGRTGAAPQSVGVTAPATSTTSPNVSTRTSRATRYSQRSTSPSSSAVPSTSSSTSSSGTSSGTAERPKATLGSRNSGRGVGRGSGSGQGESGRAGIQGSPDGSVAYSLGKRRLVARPSSYGSFSQSGRVRIQIYVNRAGNIIRHRILSSTSSELSNLAVSRLSQVKFNKSSQAPPEQQGTLTFKFLLR